MSEDAAKKSILNANEIQKKMGSLLTKNEATSHALAILESQRHCLVATNAEDGYPNIKTMSNRKHEGLKTIWFKTDTFSMRVQQLMKDNRACVYLLDAKLGRGLMLVGLMDVIADVDIKRLILIKGEEKYNPLGVDDPGWCVLRFTAKRANVVDAMQNKGLTFEIE